MKQLFSKLVAIYNYHGKFYAFVHGVEGAVVAALTAYVQSGGTIPTSKTALYALAGFLGKYVYGYIKGFILEYFAQTKGA